jgi:hypothetical protein
MGQTKRLDKPGKVEHFEKRFGILAFQKGFMTADDLITALTIQVNEDVREGRHRLLGEILFDMDLLTSRQIEEVISSVIKH